MRNLWSAVVGMALIVQLLVPGNGGSALGSHETILQQVSTGKPTGVELLNECEAASRVMRKAPNLSTDDLVAAASCFSYLQGFYQASSMLQILNQSRFHATAASDAYICFPSDGVSGEQMALVLLKFLHDHPERLNELQPGLVFDALKQAFPCK